MKISEIQETVDQAELKRRSKRLAKILRAEKFNNKLHVYAEYYSKKYKKYRETNRALSHRRDIKKIEVKSKSISERIRIMCASYHEDYTKLVLKRELTRCLLWATECPRAVVTPHKLRLILLEIMKNRINRYFNNTMEEKKKLMCIVGPSGSGKTLASLHLKYKLDANVICSFTTRPPRKTEVEGRDHHFIDIHPEEIDILAITRFGGYLYYALKDQVHGACTVYVIDENGLRDLMENHGDEYRIFKVYIDRRVGLRRTCKVDKDRIRRDNNRTPFDPDFYDYVIDNNSTKRHLFESIEKIYNEIANMD